MLLYIAIAIVTVGSLPFSRIAIAKDYVLAEAAKPMLGDTGFTIITIAALISTFSAINASLFGGSRVNYQISIDNESPVVFRRLLWDRPVGLILTSVLTILLVNTIPLENISIAGSINFLLIFSLVNYVWFRLAKGNNRKKILPFCGVVLCTSALVTLIIQEFNSNRSGVLISMGIILTCFIYEAIYKKLSVTKDQP